MVSGDSLQDARQRPCFDRVMVRYDFVVLTILLRRDADV